MKNHLFIIFLSLIVFQSCQKNEPINMYNIIEDNISKISISQGIAGTVYYREGNFQPVVEPGSGIEYPLSRNVFLHAYTDPRMSHSVFIELDCVKTDILSQIQSDANGFYQFEISEIDTFSIFVKEDNKYYLDFMDGQGGLNPVRVYPDSVMIYNIVLDYNACY